MLLLTGCSLHSASQDESAAGSAGQQAAQETLLPGVLHRSLPTGDGAGIDLIDVDLAHSPVRPVIATEGTTRRNGMLGLRGRAYTPRQWLDNRAAIAAVNGGYFGPETADGRKEIIGLFVEQGQVRRPAFWLHGRGGAGLAAGHYTRSAFGLTARGLPAIAWVVSGPVGSSDMRAYSRPQAQGAPRGRPWHVRQAVGCGPTLISGGQVVTTDRQERLVSEGPHARTFVAYDNPAGTPRHFVMGIVSGMAYDDLAAFLKDYFPHYDHTQAAAAMCLDGGSSSQLSYRQGQTVQSPRDTGMTVPDAVVLLPR